MMQTVAWLVVAAVAAQVKALCNLVLQAMGTLEQAAEKGSQG